MSNALAAIQQAARQYGIKDWRALAAVAHAESGLNPGSIGDGGTSFGLFQLHQGGALGNMSGSQARQYLDAYRNASFAARQMRQLGIHHLTGREAIDAIVRRFERSANPSGEVARAWAWYTGNGGSAAPSAPVSTGVAAPMSTSQPVQGQDLSGVQSVLDRNAKAFHLPKIQLPATAPSNVSFNLAPDQGVHVNDIPSASHIGGAIANAAKQFLGISYVWGGNSPKQGFDCSGLTKYVMAKFGVKIPRVAADQFNAGQKVGLNQAQAGDLIFFRHGDGSVGHVGIYLGNGQFLHAPHTGDHVKISKLAGYGLPVAGVRRFAR